MHVSDTIGNGPAQVPASQLKLALGSVGVVYGDIGTSPLYALREALHAASGSGLERETVVGIVSLLLWTLIIIVTLKYVVLLLRADNRGEGGTLSLLALAQQALGRRTPLLFALGVIGAALFYGDAIITPAISVLGAVEGMKLISPRLSTFVVPITVAIIAVLFLVQRSGTGRIATWFGPITAVWFLAIGGLGLWHVGDDLAILWAFNPMSDISFIGNHGLAALPVMGAVFLAVTGAEALYADMGHFGRGPIRIAWAGLVFPALALNYLGQGALVLANPAAVENPFYLLAPEFLLPPLVLLATAAAVIASQAVITGAYSLTYQAIQLGLLPRLEVRHTSDTLYGQIYLPRVNVMLLIGVLSLVVFFGNSGSLASAYGIAVTGTMVITSMLAFIVLNRVWKWPLWLTVAVILPIMVIEMVFLGANLAKVFQGGFLPLIMAAAVGIAMWTWAKGTRIVQQKAHQQSVALDTLLSTLDTSSSLSRVPGTAVFLTSDPDAAPSALLHNLKHNRVLHQKNLLVTVVIANTPRAVEAEQIKVEVLNDSFTKVQLTFGYLEQPNVPKALGRAKRAGVKFDIMSTSIFLNRRTFRTSSRSQMPLWQERLYIAMTKSASDASSFYHLPSNRVLELGQQFNV